MSIDEIIQKISTKTGLAVDDVKKVIDTFQDMAKEHAGDFKDKVADMFNFHKDKDV